jgi:hypothetical protein
MLNLLKNGVNRGIIKMAKKRRLRKTGILNPKVDEAPKEEKEVAPEPVKVKEAKPKTKPKRRWLKGSSDEE